MKASIIITGSEILKGIRKDALIQSLALQMTSQGIRMDEVRVIGDDHLKLQETILDLSSSSDLIVVTGGLGMTPDDTTHLAIQGLLEAGKARPGPQIDNPVGFAKGMDLQITGGPRVVFLPGVPREAHAMFRDLVDSLHEEAEASIEIAVFGLGETEIARRLGSVADVCSFLPRDMEIALIAPKEHEPDIRRILKKHVLEGQDLSATVAGLLRRKNLSCVTAESCTGGLIAHLITELPGSSDYFLGSVVSYSNEVKVKVLGVPEETLRLHGAVSLQTAEAMLEGVLDLTGADVGVATTGIAGPSGGTEDKPVGTVWIAAGSRQGHIAETFRFPFDRQGNKMIFAKTALFLLRSFINDTDIHRV